MKSTEDELKRLQDENARLRAELEEAQAWALFPLRSPEAIFRLDAEGHLAMANAAGQALLREWEKGLPHPIDHYLRVMRQWFARHSNPINRLIRLGQRYYRLEIFSRRTEQTFDVILRDVTEGTRMRQDLKAALTRMKSLIYNMQAGVLVEDQHRQIVLVNEDFCRLFEIPVPAEALEGADCSQAAHQSKSLFADPEGFIEGVERILTKREVVLGEILELADGRFVERDYIPVWEHTRYLGHLWKYRDVTNTELKLRALTRSEEKFRTLIENMNLGLMQVDNEDRVEYVNHSLQQMTGFSAEEMLGRKAGPLLTDPEALRIIEQKARDRQEGLMDVYEIPAQRKDGSRVWFLISGAPVIGPAGDVVGSIGIHLDITQRKVLEEDLRTAKSAAEASAMAKEQFLATVSHEIRTPMNAILGMQKLMMKTALEDRQRRYMEAIGISAGNLMTLVNDVLDFSKMQAGKVEIVQAPFDLREMVRAIVNVLEFKADEKRISLRVALDATLPQYVLGDSNRIHQVLMNLVGNAVKFTEHGHVMLSLIPEGEDRICFRVEDTGPGMDAETARKVFDAFSQADSSISKKYGGTGLGLSISKELVELQGGDLQVSSEPGVGSSFWFALTLPACQPELMEELSRPAEDLRLDGKLVLVVEDNDFNRLLAQTVLESIGASVALAVHGQQALEKAEEQHPDAVLMDLQMPVMDGMEASRRLRTGGYAGPILALTANAFPEVREKCLEAGMNDMVVKPFNERQLVEKLAAWMTQMPTPSTPPQVTLNLSRLKELSQHRMEFVHQMVRLAKTQIVETLAEMEAALAREDIDTLWQLAHRLKATLDHLDVQPCRFTIRQLENLRKGGTLLQARKGMAAFRDEVASLVPLLEKVQTDVQAY